MDLRQLTADQQGLSIQLMTGFHQPQFTPVSPAADDLGAQINIALDRRAVCNQGDINHAAILAVESVTRVTNFVLVSLLILLNQWSISCVKEQRTKSAQMDTSRRNLIKKATYSAPALVTLGLLTVPRNAEAQCDPILDPDCLGISGPNSGSYTEELNPSIETEKEELA